MAATRSYDVAVLFSTDQDFFELVQSLKRLYPRLVVACAHGGTFGIKRAKGVHYDRAVFDACLDGVDYNQRFSLNERNAGDAARHIADVAIKWDRPRMDVQPSSGPISGTLRALVPVTGGGHAYACVDDGTNLLVASLPRRVWKHFARDLGRLTVVNVDSRESWTHVRAGVRVLAE